MKAYHVHYMNKYPGGRVESSDEKLNAYDANGRHCVALAKDGGGSWKDCSAELGLPHRHCLSPIPKESRLFKVRGGAIAKDEQFETRSKMASKFVQDYRVLSCEELADSSEMQFDKSHSLKD